MISRLRVLVGAIALVLSFAPPLAALQPDSTDAPVVLIVDSLDRAAFANVSELLQARVPGLHIARNGEGGMRWFMRGPASVEDISPMILLDGARLTAANSSFRATGTRPPVLDDIDIEAVERVEVWSGPATAAKYGTGAAQGVIRIVTFAPAASPTTFRVIAATGIIDDHTTYPANFHRAGVTPGGAPTACLLIVEARGGCVPTDLTSINVLESDSPFELGVATRIAGTLAGGNEGLSWRARATLDRDGSPTGAVTQRLHVRGAGSIRASEQANLTLRAHWTRGKADLPSLDEPSLLRQGLFARADTAWSGFTVPHTSDYGSDRYGAIVTGTWQPYNWVDVRLTSGLERLVDEDDLEYLVPDNTGGPLFIDDRGERRRRDLTVRLEAEARHGGAWLRHATTASVEHAVSRQEDESRELRRRDGAFSLRTFGLNVRSGITGLGLMHALHLGERATVTGGVRLDRLKLNDTRWETPIFPHVSFSWVARPFSPASLGGIRLRGGLGHAAGALQPSLFFFPPPSGGDRPQAEVTREREVGIDVHAFQDRLALSVTGYRKRTSDIPQLLTSPFFQFGRLEVLNRGIEASLRTRILQTARLTWDVHAWYAHNHNEVTRSDLLPHPIELGDTFTPHVQWVFTGQPLAVNRITSTIVSIRDLDGDGLLDSVCSEGQAECELTVGPATDFRPAFPPTSASLATSVRYRTLTLTVLFDHRSGHALHNLPLEERCFTRCQALFDPATSIQDQAQALLAGSDEFFLEDASYTKLRELSIRFSAPASWARALRAARFDISLAGRNLATWTDYSGLDPESASLPWVSLAQVDNAAMPLPRRLLIRAELQGR